MNVFDIIGPIMIGPSSSHTAGAVRIGKIARSIYGKEPKKVKIILHGSFAKTGKGHGTDKAIVAGILNFNVDDIRLRDSLSIAKERDMDIVFTEQEFYQAHPNTAKIIFYDEYEKEFSLQGSSVGGGSVIVSFIDELSVNLMFDSPVLIVRHQDKPGAIAFVSEELYKQNMNISKFGLARRSKGGIAIMTIGLDSKPCFEIIKNIEKSEFVIGVDFIDEII